MVWRKECCLPGTPLLNSRFWCWVLHEYDLDEKEFELSASLQVQRCFSNWFLSNFLLISFSQFVRVLIFALCRFMV